MSTGVLDCTAQPSHSLTFQEYQSIYAELTQKNEGLNKFYEKSFTLKKEDISNLKCLLDDILRQYNIITSNTNVTVSQSDNVVKEYSSIENFIAVSTLTKATESVLIEYNILIQVPNIEKKQNYKISLRIVSDLIAFESLRNSFPPELLDIIEKNNIELKIDYVDYTIAKSILHTIDDWVEEISYPINQQLNFIIQRKKIIASLIKNLIMFFTILLIYINISLFITQDSTNLQSLAKFFVLSYLCIYCAQQISYFSHSLIRRNLTFLQNYSFIQLTEEDKKNIQRYKAKKGKRILASIGIGILAIIYGIISSVIATKYILG